jgi:hypothetical protein
MYIAGHGYSLQKRRRFAAPPERPLSIAVHTLEGREGFCQGRSKVFGKSRQGFCRRDQETFRAFRAVPAFSPEERGPAGEERWSLLQNAGGSTRDAG